MAVAGCEILITNSSGTPQQWVELLVGYCRKKKILTQFMAHSHTGWIAAKSLDMPLTATWKKAMVKVAAAVAVLMVRNLELWRVSDLHSLKAIFSSCLFLCEMVSAKHSPTSRNSPPVLCLRTGRPDKDTPEPESVERFKTRFKRRRKLNWTGAAVFILYIVAFIAYMFIRITKTLGGLGPYLVYGIFVLIVEVLGATTTLIYGAPLLPSALPSFVCCVIVVALYTAPYSTLYNTL